MESDRFEDGIKWGFLSIQSCNSMTILSKNNKYNISLDQSMNKYQECMIQTLYVFLGQLILLYISCNEHEINVEDDFNENVRTFLITYFLLQEINPFKVCGRWSLVMHSVDEKVE